MLYEAGQYAYPGLNAILYAFAFAVVALSSMGAYAIYKTYNP